MNANIFFTHARNRAKRIPMGLGFAFPLAVVFLQLKAGAQEVNLGTANDFGSWLARRSRLPGAANTTSINGNIDRTPPQRSRVLATWS